MKATALCADSSLQRMIRLAREADENKAPIVSLADKWATWLVVIALLCAAGTWIITGEFIRAVTVLVVFCPCAFILATSTAVMAGIANAAKHGILICSGDALERLSKVTKIAFDKTGTLTKGKPSPIFYKSLSPDFSDGEILSLSASGKNALSILWERPSCLRRKKKILILLKFLIFPSGQERAFAPPAGKSGFF